MKEGKEENKVKEKRKEDVKGVEKEKNVSRLGVHEWNKEIKKKKTSRTEKGNASVTYINLKKGRNIKIDLQREKKTTRARRIKKPLEKDKLVNVGEKTKKKSQEEE